MKTILITGVSSGIGLGLARKFLEQNYKVAGSVRTQVQAESLQKELGKNFLPLVFDITDRNSVLKCFEPVKEFLNGAMLDGIINNAGTTEIGPLLYVSPEDFRKQLDILVVGQLNVIQVFYNLLIPGNGSTNPGRIVNMSSISGTGSNYLFGCYVAGKHALEGMSKTLRQELKLFGIKVIVVAPGNIATKIWGKQTTDIIEKYKDTVYFQSLRKSLESIYSKTVDQAMSVEEFSDAFFTVYTNPDPLPRYTIIKAKARRNPFSKEKLRVFGY